METTNENYIPLYEVRKVKTGDVISKNFKLGEPIATCEELYSMQGQSCYCTVWDRMNPVAWFVSMQFRQVILLIQAKRLFKIVKIENGND